ncbi:PAS domain-containing protein [Mesorhizobium sp. M1005]|uniref:chemotaxis protein CheB n=1 Tax=unclassified Mesorhizobium TaxID=325217 RepID=UPI003335F4D1
MVFQNGRFPIVGVGASAGGIPAMEGLFKGLTGGTGMAFVVVTNLSPERESLLHDVIARYTGMPVIVAEEGMAVQPDQVYVMPQNVVLTIRKGALSLRRPNTLNRERKPIDIFFRALAEDQGEYAIGIILSGGDSDGTLGARAIKEHGGLTIAQASDGSGARNPDMPQSAISSGLIDIAAPAEEIGAKLQAFGRGFNVLNGLAEGGGEHKADMDRAADELDPTLRGHSGHDFSSLKTKTFSVNEEAQSTNELEASKEEMQSLNEELNTINAELTGKIEELDRANSDLRNLFESTEIATIFLDRNLVVRTFTPAASSFFNLRPSDVGRPLTDLSSQLDYPELKRHIQAVFETGETLNHHLARDDKGRFYLVRINPYRDKGGSIQGVVVTMIDVTTLAQAEERQQVLISELNHRVKNMLAVVASITNRTREYSASKEEFAEALIGRLHAMSRAYSLLSRESWTEASVEELLHQELDAFGAERFELDGKRVSLKPVQGLSFGMAIHELATNAAKYGALSKPAGRIIVKWSVVDGTFKLVWREKGGPRIKEPTDSGFGLTLLRGEIGYRLGGKVETSFRSNGLEAEIAFPLTREESS